MDRLAVYRKLNDSFNKTYIFTFGSEGGFYSEFNNMIFGMIYCLKYQYRFVLYTGNSKFNINKGWTDFFEPFCEEITSSSFHKKFNRREIAPKIKPKNRLVWWAYRLFNGNTALTYELFSRFYNGDFEKEQFDFPELGLKGNLRDISREFVKMVYQFNFETKTNIQPIMGSVNLPVGYISLNIRRGDKDTEFNFVPVSVYVDKAREQSGLKDIFILTDDYTVIENLQRDYPYLNFYTLVKKEERGYVHADFMKESPQKRQTDLVKLFASIQLMASSTLAVGTYTTNPGLFLGMYMPEDKFISVQKKSWYQFEKEDVRTFIVKPSSQT
ncbi:hypothetical protein [Mucilaginibacter sp. UR6-11]|uniref:hypothetical protein n=1 Tax=Mucilaginibacter sp. UR6-11 TaxID=1435644 RepID=UPI001E2C90BE|nr:hypothetical protein [Mucilaginibacter sp. UR6-11]MCC8424339.1 hypothetical protein [Mucilaginibacter sp. UR6-11]